MTDKETEKPFMRYLLMLCAMMITILAVFPASAARMNTGEDLVRAMHKKYNKSWYKTLTFVQKTVEHHEDGTTKASIWYEAYSAPGRLRIDFDPISSGNGILFSKETLHSFKDGALANSRPFVHPLMVLGFDVYVVPVEETINKLKQLKFDLSLLREDVWQNRPVYVVGARAGDLHSKQFWIDKENLYFVRLLEPAGKDGKLTSETQFNKYFKVKGGGWVAPEVIFMVDGKTRITEEYSEVSVGVRLDDKLFDPDHWRTARWR